MGTIDQVFLTHHNYFQSETILKTSHPLIKTIHEASHPSEPLVESRLTSSPRKRHRSNSSPEKICKSRKSDLTEIVPTNELISPIPKRRSLRNLKNQEKQYPESSPAKSSKQSSILD